MMQGTHYGNVIKHLEVSHLEQIPVPMVARLGDEIHERIGAAFAAREEADRLDMTGSVAVRGGNERPAQNAAGRGLRRSGLKAFPRTAETLKPSHTTPTHSW